MRHIYCATGKKWSILGISCCIILSHWLWDCELYFWWPMAPKHALAFCRDKLVAFHAVCIPVGSEVTSQAQRPRRKSKKWDGASVCAQALSSTIWFLMSPIWFLTKINLAVFSVMALWLSRISDNSQQATGINVWGHVVANSKYQVVSSATGTIGYQWMSLASSACCRYRCNPDYPEMWYIMICGYLSF